MFVDPLAEETMTPYQYVTNNPIMFTDPTGMSQEGWGKKGDTWEYDAEITADNYKQKGYDKYMASGNVYSTTDGKADGGYNYSLNANGSVQDKGGNYMSSSFTTDYGTNINVSSGTSFSDVSTAGQLGGSFSFGLLKEGASNRMDKSLYSLGNSSYSGSLGSAEMDFHAMNSAKSMQQMKTLSATMGVMSKALDYAGYIDGGLKISNGEYGSGIHSIGNNYAGILIGARMGWGYGLLYNASYAGWEYILNRSESYNRMIYGKGTPGYNKRMHYWKKSKILKE